jgi:hypothetical protein
METVGLSASCQIDPSRVGNSVEIEQHSNMPQPSVIYSRMPMSSIRSVHEATEDTDSHFGTPLDVNVDGSVEYHLINGFDRNPLEHNAHLPISPQPP